MNQPSPFTAIKLYFSPGACSLSPHIALYESGLPFQAVFASTRSHKLQDGTDYYTINPKGYVPLLEFDDGSRLTEGPAIVQWIADQVPERKLAPSNGTMERYRLQEWLTFIGTEIHKQFSPLFHPAMPQDAKALFRQKIVDRLAYADRHLAGRLPAGQQLQRRRRLPLHRGPLGCADAARHLRVREPRGVHGPDGRAAGGTAGAEGRRPGGLSTPAPR
jgi:glutathione S-transferase